MLRLLSRFLHKPNQNLARQLSAYQRQSAQVPGVAPARLPYSTYEQMQADAMVQTALTIKRLAVVAASIEVRPFDESPEARRNADFVEEAFSRLKGSPADILHQAMDAFAKGWSIQEMIFSESNGKIWLDEVVPKNPEYFGLELDPYGSIRGLTMRIPDEPQVQLPLEKFVVYRNRAQYGRPRGLSDLDAAHRHWQSKQALLNAWRVHLERFASPTVLGRYERGLPPEEQARILGAIQNLHENTAIVFPNEIEVSTLGVSRESSSGFLDAIDFHNREIARSILGQTLTTDEGRRVGSLALGKVHLQVLLLQVNSIRRELAEMVLTEQVVRRLVEVNFGAAKIPKVVFQAADAGAFSLGRI